MSKRCPRCDRLRPPGEFFKNKRTPDGLTTYCKPCATQAADRARRAARERILAERQETEARCRKCQCPWPLGKSGRQVICKSCKARQWQDNKISQGIDPRSLRRSLIVADQDRERLTEIQKRTECEICGKSEQEEGRRLAIDHCHETDRIRGALCMDCNRAIGLLKDDPSLMEKAATYIRTARDRSIKIRRPRASPPEKLSA